IVVEIIGELAGSKKAVGQLYVLGIFYDPSWVDNVVSISVVDTASGFRYLEGQSHQVHTTGSKEHLAKRRKAKVCVSITGRHGGGEKVGPGIVQTAAYCKF